MPLLIEIPFKKKCICAIDLIDSEKWSTKNNKKKSW